MSTSPDEPLHEFLDMEAYDVVPRAEYYRLREALERIAQMQPKTLAMIEHNEFRFTDIGRERGNWQHLAFSIYTDLCEVDTIARSALEKL